MGKGCIKVSAPGKLILTGEHAVVYGYPALVAAVDRRLFINQKQEVESQIPIGCGMGSSAAYVVALAALEMKLQGRKLDREEINRQAYEREKRSHGNPSGVDNTICTYGGWLWYRNLTAQSSPDLVELIRENERLLESLGVVVSRDEKKTGSTEGHEGATTNPYFQLRLKELPTRITRVKQALLAKNFRNFGEEEQG